MQTQARMGVIELVASAQSGDVEAFTALVERYQAMVFGYALAILRDRQEAEDAAQQTFITAYRSLPRLHQPDRFAAWLRGIARFECSHLRRGRRAGLVPIDAAVHLPTHTSGPEHLAEDREVLDRTLEAIGALPDGEREVTILYYVRDHSQREIAAFLNLTVATVNNRLRRARMRLKQGGLLEMARETLKRQGLPDDFAERVGRIVAVQGRIIDARFARDARPTVLNALHTTDPVTGQTTTFEVAQHLADDLVRCIALDDGERRAEYGRDAEVIDSAAAVTKPLDLAAVQEVVRSVRRPPSSRTLLETGIKAIDLLCPLPTSGLIGLAGAPHVGKMVLVEELIHRLDGSGARLTMLVFVRVPEEVAALPRMEYRTSAEVEAVYLPVADAGADALAALDGLDAMISLSRALGAERLYPAVDAANSTSALLDPAIIGEEHSALARGLRTHLQHRADASDADASRSRRVQRYLTQPFFVAEPFTNRPGSIVPSATAVRDARALLDGAWENLPDDAITMIGSLGDAGHRGVHG